VVGTSRSRTRLLCGTAAVVVAVAGFACTKNGSASKADPPATRTTPHRATATTTEAPTTTTAAPASFVEGTVPRPDPKLTPGSVFSTVTLAQMCVSGYTKTVRDVPVTEKAQVFAEYGITDVPGAYEVDHLISLELGGDNTIANLWPEPYTGDAGARRKDVLENKLHALVCSHEVALGDAQRAIADDWWVAYQEYEPMPTVATTIASTRPSPATTQPSGSAHPAGTTGRCNDETYTSAAHSQGACSHHGGLAEYWG